MSAGEFHLHLTHCSRCTAIVACPEQVCSCYKAHQGLLSPCQVQPLVQRRQPEPADEGSKTPSFWLGSGVGS